VAVAHEERLALACVEAGGHTLGIDVRQVREIVRVRPLTPLPDAPRLIEGVVELRGKVIPVVDLARALGQDPVSDEAHACIALVEVEGLALGLRVAAALEVLSADSATIASPPRLATEAGYDAVESIVQRPGRAPVLVLRLEALRARIRASQDRVEGPAS
jgi:purine-binding chemotaxis protein CheW